MEGLEKLLVSGGLREIVLEFEGLKLPIKVKDMSWSKKNQIVSQCFEFKAEGERMAFNLDLYKKQCLMEMIKEAPWGETNLIFLNQIKPEFGSILESIVPKVGDENKVKEQDFFVKESNK